MAERTSTCRPHNERETLQVYLYVPWVLSFVGGRGYLYQYLPQRRNGRTTAEDQAPLHWPPRSPDLTPCDFFSWWYVKDSVFLPPLPQDIPDLRRRIIAVIPEINHDMLRRIWAEMDWHLPCHKGRTHTALMRCAEKTWFYEMCQRIMNNPVYIQEQTRKKHNNSGT